MNGEQDIEHILLASDDEPGMAPRTTERRFAQASEFMGHRAAYEIFNGHYMEIRSRSWRSQSRRYVLDLAFLDPEPLRRRVVAWRWLGAALGLLAVSALPAVYAHYSPSAELTAPWIATVILSVAASAVILLWALHRSCDKLLFHSQHGRAALLEFLNNKPAKHEFRAFVQDLIQRIRQAREQRYPSSRALLAAELREHRRLRDEGVIDADEYDAVKARILQSHGVDQL